MPVLNLTFYARHATLYLHFKVPAFSVCRVTCFRPPVLTNFYGLKSSKYPRLDSHFGLTKAPSSQFIPAGSGLNPFQIVVPPSQHAPAASEKQNLSPFFFVALKNRVFYVKDIRRHFILSHDIEHIDCGDYKF